MTIKNSKSNSSLNNPLFVINSDHESIMDHIYRMDELIGEKNYTTLVVHLVGMTPFFKNSLVEHFEIEDQIIFPAVLQSNPPEKITKLVEELTSEHEKFRIRLNKLNEFLHKKEDEIMGKIVPLNNIST